MSQADEILSELRRRRVVVAMAADILCLKPRRAVDDTLLARIREVKPAILEACGLGLPHCTGCYDVGDGRRIHPPRCGEAYRARLEGWTPIGKGQ